MVTRSNKADGRFIVPGLVEFVEVWLGLTLSQPQRVLLTAIAGLPLPPELAPLWSKHSGRDEAYTPRQWAEVLALCGRRSGKSAHIAAPLAVHEALFRDVKLTAGEVPRVVVVAQNLRASQIVLSYVRAALRRVEERLDAQIIVSETVDEIRLKNARGLDVIVGCYPATVRSLRGATIVCAICDELAFWMDEDSRNPAGEVLEAIRPAMATVPGARLVMATTPWGKTGIVWDMYKDRAEHEDLLVFHSSTSSMNPMVPQKFLDREQKRDPEVFKREYLAEFVDSVSGFLAYAEIRACVDEGLARRPYDARQHYIAAVDPSARRNDPFAVVIGHAEEEQVFIDFCHAWPASTLREGLSTEALLEELGALLREYQVTRAVSDQFSYEVLKGDCRRLGFTLEERPWSAQSKARAFVDFRAKVLTGKLRMVDHNAAIRELVMLEQRMATGGLMRFEAPRNLHDDLATCIAMLAHELTPRPRPRVRVLHEGWGPPVGPERRAHVASLNAMADKWEREREKDWR
jgi:hypothetical protein